MNNQFSQRVSDIIVYSKEEANRLRSRHIGPEHLLLGMLRDGEGKAIEILSKLNTACFHSASSRSHTSCCADKACST